MTHVDLTDIQSYTTPRTRAVIALLLVERVLPRVTDRARADSAPILSTGWRWARGENVDAHALYRLFSSFMEEHFLDPDLPDELTDPMCLVVEGLRSLLWELYATGERDIDTIPSDLLDYTGPALAEIGPYAEKALVLDDSFGRALEALRSQADEDHPRNVEALRELFQPPPR